MSVAELAQPTTSFEDFTPAWAGRAEAIAQSLVSQQAETEARTSYSAAVFGILPCAYSACCITADAAPSGKGRTHDRR